LFPLWTATVAIAAWKTPKARQGTGRVRSEFLILILVKPESGILLLACTGILPDSGICALMRPDERYLDRKIHQVSLVDIGELERKG
jgi:hypothetical protein